MATPLRFTRMPQPAWRRRRVAALPAAAGLALFCGLLVGGGLLIDTWSASQPDKAVTVFRGAGTDHDSQVFVFRGGAGRDATVRRGPTVDTAFALCGRPPHTTCVIDGDTFYLDGQSIRLADIDAPETHEPECASEAELGDQATRRLLDLLNAGPFLLETPAGPDHDIYGRELRTVQRGGRSLGAVLVAEGLARAGDAPPHSWCR
ncbi:MAG: thermonuclease family protein [Alphaproteobacteria bacterium]